MITLAATDPQIRAAHQRRLQKLQLRAAEQGTNTPPEVLTEIEAIEATLTSPTQASETHWYLVLAGQIQEVRADVRQLFLVMLVLMPILMILLAAFMVALVKV